MNSDGDTIAARDGDTIAAIATAGSEGCISIVRLSGSQSLQIADKITRGSQKPTQTAGNTVLYAHVVDADGKDIDEVLLLIQRAPKSYTCEECIEIQGHGGRISAGRILQRSLDAGARLAEPGEFTKRAFLNGRIDLLQAEAVQDLVKARSEEAAKLAVAQLEGGLSRKMNELYDDILALSANLEATLDFSEEHLLIPVYEENKNIISLIINKINKLMESWQQGHLLREGLSIVIAGRPNTGKSTLLNRLLDKERAIVSPYPGTTRDTIEENLIMDGIILKLIDTAGLRVTDCRIEQDGIERTRQSIRRADILLYMLDASEELDPEIAILRENRNVLFIINKSDIEKYDHTTHLVNTPWVKVSLLHESGAEMVKGAVKRFLTLWGKKQGETHVAVSTRHRDLLLKAQQAMNEALKCMQENPEEQTWCAAEQVRVAAQAVGCITGRVYYEELLDHVFSTFCIGK